MQYFGRLIKCCEHLWRGAESSQPSGTLLHVRCWCSKKQFCKIDTATDEELVMTQKFNIAHDTQGRLLLSKLGGVSLPLNSVSDPLNQGIMSRLEVGRQRLLLRVKWLRPPSHAMLFVLTLSKGLSLKIIIRQNGPNSAWNHESTIHYLWSKPAAVSWSPEWLIRSSTLQFSLHPSDYKREGIGVLLIKSKPDQRRTI